MSINIPPETNEQQIVIQYLRRKKIPHTSMPNENKYGGVITGLLINIIGKIRAMKTSAKIVSSIENKMKAEGKQKGYPDIIIDRSNRYYHGLRIEMKRQKKQLQTKLSTAHTKVSPEQKEWIETLKNEGYYAVVCYGAKEAIGVIDDYMENR